MNIEPTENRQADNPEEFERSLAEARGEIERRWEDTFNAIEAMIAIIDADRKIVQVNEAVKKAFSGVENIVGKPCHAIFHNTDAPVAGCSFCEVFETGVPVHRELREASLGDRWFDVYIYPVRGAGGKVKEVVHVVTDITERKQYAEKLARANEELIRSNRELEEFAYVISHDLKEPLRKIMYFGDRLRDACGGALPEQAGEYISRMHKAAERMERLISDLLAYSRVNATPREYVAVDLGRIVREAVADFEEVIKKTGGEVAAGDLPKIEFEPFQVRQLMQNLIGNALKFRRPGTPPRVEIRAETAGENSLRLVVEDNGIGFDNQYREKIFGVFRRLHGRDEYEGTGIGLSICKKIVTAHGGTIEADGEPGKGARFTATLPMKQQKK